MLNMVADYSNISWLPMHNLHVAAYVRSLGEKRLFCVFNFGSDTSFLTWFAFKQLENAPNKLYDHWQKKEFTVGADHEYLVIAPYSFYLLEQVG